MIMHSLNMNYNQYLCLLFCDEYPIQKELFKNIVVSENKDLTVFLILPVMHRLSSAATSKPVPIKDIQYVA